MSDNDVFHRVSMVMNVDQAEIAKIVHDYLERGIVSDYDRLNCPKPPIYIKPVKLLSLRDRLIEEAAKELQNEVDKLILQKEDNEMKATSVQNIKNIKDICFDISNNPIERESKLTIVASTNDDIFAFEFEGEDLLPCCKRAGLFTENEVRKKNREINDLHQKLFEARIEKRRLEEKNEKQIKKLEQENKGFKGTSDTWSKEYYNLSKKFDKLQEENEKLKDKLENVEPFRALERTIKEKQQLKEEYEEKIKKLEHDDMLDKNAADYWSKEHDALLERFKKLQEENEKLKQLKTPTIENFVDEEPSSRRDILRCAEKCVCGQREQDYGTPESNFKLIADLWNGYLGEKTDNPIISVTPVDVSMMMALMKIARIRNGGGSGDSFVDLAGYAACGGEIWALKKETNGDSN